MNGFDFSNEDRTITVYGYLSENGQYIGKSDCYIPAKTGLPAYCTHIAPPSVHKGMVAVFNESKQQWLEVEDHRGRVVYRKENGTQYVINALGPIPETMTELAPAGDFDRWNGLAWEKDVEAEARYLHNQVVERKGNFIAEASQRIDILTDKINLNMVDDIDLTREKITAWRKYRAKVDDIDPANQPKEWPLKPE